VIRESNGKLAAGDKYGEEYSEYHGQLQDRCIQYCDREQYLSHVLNAIASLPELRSSDIDLLSNLYTNPKFSVSAAQRARINDAFISAATDPASFLTRASGLGAIGVAIRSGLPSPEHVAHFHRTTVKAASDPDVNVRLGAVRRLTELKDPFDLPLLQRLAAEDTARSMKAGMAVYPVRDAARSAVADIKSVP
jgi:HEAT repeat protein